MPELPEVETICRGLHKKIVMRTIRDVAYRRANLRNVLPIAMPRAVRGKRVVDVTRISKYAVILLEDGAGILLHMGMSGRLLFHEGKRFVPAKHDHVILRFDGDMRVVFNDARRFGVMEYLESPFAIEALRARVGTDPLSGTVTPSWLSARMADRKTPIKHFLMDQRHLAGLGNIYVCEALYRAKISPRRMAGDVTPSETRALVKAIRDVLNEAIAAGGSSLRDYVQTDGELGYFQNKFRVYGREGQACLRCGDRIERIVQAGRSSFYCPSCQTL